MKNLPSVIFPLIAIFVLPILVTAQSITEKQRQFDFWIGEWDVNLRVRQEDKSWKDQHKSTAHIYSILGGKAILELWSEKQDGINGYSLRYYNPKTDKWDLWLNWPGKNRSGTNGLTGSFRHGRGEFFSERKIDEKTTQISRYTFSDATPNSLRWDDGFSRDGGKTWSSNWIMEFSRRAEKAPAIGSGKNLHTYFDGSRCDLPEFEYLKTILKNQDEQGYPRLYGVLDGCMILGFLENEKTFFTLTYNTYAKTYEMGILDSRTDSRFALYYGDRYESGLALKSKGRGASDDEIVNIFVSDSGIWAMNWVYEGNLGAFSNNLTKPVSPKKRQ